VLLSEDANMISETNTLIGHLTEVSGEEYVAQLISEEDGYTPEITAGNDRIRIGQVGSYVIVRQAGLYLLTMVDSQWQEPDSVGDIVRTVRLTPLGEISARGGFERGITHHPTTGAELHLVTVKTLSGLFAKFSKEGYKVGKLSAFDSIDVFLDASAFFGRHAAILGQSGSGKSWSVTSLIQSALRAMPNAHIVLIDLHGEYSHKENDPTTHYVFDQDKVRSIDAQELEMPYWLLTYSELIELLIDDVDPNASVQIAFLRRTVLDLKREANEHLDIGHITVDSPVYFSMEEMFQRFKLANEETSSFGKAQTALTGKFDQLLVRLESRYNDNRYDFMLRPAKRTNSESLPDLMRDFIGLGEKKANITVIDLSGVPSDVQPTVTAQIGRLAFEFNYWNPRRREFPIFLVCEEAHAYIPRRGRAGHMETRRTMERIAKEGRKYGVGICVVSQRPHELSETVLAQCSTYICLRISNPDDQEYVRTLVPDSARGVLESITSLAQGEAIALGEAVPMPVRFRVTMPDPTPNSSNVDYATKWARGPEEISVEHLVDRWRKQEH
jgi:DNA helicase HerA-like ATPase